MAKRWFFLVFLLLLLPLKVHGAELTPEAVSPFLAEYQLAGQTGADIPILYHLRLGSTTLPVYSADPGREPEAGAFCAESLSGGLAGKIRAVVRLGYPSRSTHQLEQAANPWLIGQGMEPLENLQTGEALTATQLALWRMTVGISSGSQGGWKDLTAGEWRSLGNAALTQQPGAHTESNIRSLCAYLENLDPLEPETPLLPKDALAGTRYQATEEPAGWCVRLEISLVLPENAEALTLSATCGGTTQTQYPEGSGTWEFTFSGLDAPKSATVTLAGQQQAGDVYLFSHNGTRLVGYAEGTLPLYATVTLEPERVLHLEKTAEGLPVPGCRFRLYLAAEAQEVADRTVRLGSQPGREAVAAIQTPENLLAELTTNESGQADFSFTAAGAPDGVYLLVEEDGASARYLTVPGAEGGILSLHLEGTGQEVPELAVTVAGGSFAPEDLQDWCIRVTLPTGLETVTVTDLLPKELTLVADSLAVHLLSQAGEEKLVEGSHYLRPEAMELTLTPAGLAYAHAQQEPVLVIRFQATFSEQARVGVPAENPVRLDYAGATGVLRSITATAQADTAGLHLTLTNDAGKAVAGAVYRLARPAAEGEAASYIKVAGQRLPVVYMAFRAEPDLSGERTNRVTTDARGNAWFWGLPRGTYYLVKAGEEPVPVTLTGETTLAATGQRQHPMETVLTLIGLTATAAACFLLHKSRQQINSEL